MEIKSVFDKSFIPYGRVVENLKAEDILEALKNTPCPSDGTVYEPGCAALEAQPSAKEIELRCYGGMPIQIGYCNGYNKALNCLEYHRDSEIDIPLNDVVLLVASQQKIQNNTIDVSQVEAFLAPKGTVVELYATTLHYAPCCAKGEKGFRVVIVLPKGTNTDLGAIEVKGQEDKLLWARNKWLIALPGTTEAAQGACAGITGENIILE